MRHERAISRNLGNENSYLPDILPFDEAFGLIDKTMRIESSRKAILFPRSVIDAEH